MYKINAYVTPEGETVLRTRPAREWLRIVWYLSPAPGIAPDVVVGTIEHDLVDAEGAGFVALVETDTDRVAVQVALDRPAEVLRTADGSETLVLPLSRLSERPSTFVDHAPEPRFFLYEPPETAPGAPWLIVSSLPRMDDGVLRGRYSVSAHSNADEAISVIAGYAKILAEHTRDGLTVAVLAPDTAPDRRALN